MPESERYKRDKVLANLTFGFWEGLFSSYYEDLFRHHTRRSFASPPASFTRKDVSSRLEGLRVLRNRVAHHEPVHAQPLEELHEQALDLISWIDPDAGAWVRGNSRVASVLSERPVPAEPVVVVVPARDAWPLYQSRRAYVCQPGRFFRAVSHIAFYADGEIKPEVAHIEDRWDAVPWTPAEIARLKTTRDPRDGDLAELIKASRATGWTQFDSQQVFLLTAPGHPRHVTLSAPVRHTRSGIGSAYVQRQRYVRLTDLERAETTGDLPAWR